FARMWFPWKGMFVFLPEPDSTFSLFSAAEGLRLYALAQLFLCINATTMMTLAFMFGCFNMKPAAATVLALSLLLFNLVMESIPAFQQYRQFLLIYHMRAWTVVFAEPIQWTRVGGSLLVLVAFNFTCLAIGVTGFQLRDIKS
ncbi:MAG: hypothetical protein HY301_07790, partial [Verrucomicrobia bacterium]|nr:hypothetical protein [Verrucomicrobiota bacterium]